MRQPPSAQEPLHSLVAQVSLNGAVLSLPLQQLALKVRLDEALHLLSTTDASLTDIALGTGFCDQSAFTRHFRRLTGLPPAAFRKSQVAVA